MGLAGKQNSDVAQQEERRSPKSSGGGSIPSGPVGRRARLVVGIGSNRPTTSAAKWRVSTVACTTTRSRSGIARWSGRRNEKRSWPCLCTLLAGDVVQRNVWQHDQPSMEPQHLRAVDSPYVRRMAAVLLTARMSVTASEVPRKSVVGLVPALPVKFQLSLVYMPV